MTFTIGLENCGHTQKPQKAEIAGINRIVVQNIQELELIDFIGNKGYTFLPALMHGSRKKENFQSMQWFVMDFDGGICFNEILQRANENRLQITFAYHTFSSTAEEERFRVVCIHEVPVADQQAAGVIIDMMLKVFPEADSSCRDVSRMFFGGKNVIYADLSARFDLVNLKNAFYRAIDKGGNFQRNLKIFARKHGIQVTNGQLLAARMNDMCLFDGKWDSNDIIFIGRSDYPSFFIVKYNHNHPIETCPERKHRIDLERIGDSCKLLCDFMNGEYLSHDAKFALATNFLNIYGGQDFFLNVILDVYGADKYLKWKQDYRYMKEYRSKRCDAGFCPYYESCQHEGTIVDTLRLGRKIFKIGEEQIFTLDESWQLMEKNLQDAFESAQKGIHLIKAQTALGKTRAYIELICRNSDSRFIIACPTNKLKEEVARKLRNHYVDCFVTPSVDGNTMVPEHIAEEISDYHAGGIHNKSKKILKDYLKEVPETHLAEREEIERIIKGLDGIAEERVVVTTHAYLLQMQADFLKGRTVIIDEDILQLQLFARTCKVSGITLRKIAGCKNHVLSRIAKTVLCTPIGKYRTLETGECGKGLSAEQMETMGIVLDKDDNINDLLFAGSYVREIEDDSETVHYFCPQKLAVHKYILLSATLNEEIYRRYFGSELPVIAYPEKKAAYKGTLKQFIYHSLGRTDLHKKMELFAIAQKLLGNDPQIITFKKFGKQNDADIHFGNSSGSNVLEGKDIAIIGTPFKEQEAYKLVACYLGADVNTAEDNQLKKRRVQYKCYDFVIMTYKQELLQKVQLYSIESELEQCIGRARLLRQDCTVYLFSAFPCEQAEIFVQDYLKDVSPA